MARGKTPNPSRVVKALKVIVLEGETSEPIYNNSGDTGHYHYIPLYTGGIAHTDTASIRHEHTHIVVLDEAAMRYVTTNIGPEHTHNYVLHAYVNAA